MPRGNRRGPFGEGPLTGRGFGCCGGADTPGYGTERPMFGRGSGSGRGRGRRIKRGMGLGPPLGNPVSRFAPPGSGENEAEMLRLQAQQLEDSLEQIKNRLSHLNEHAQRDKTGKT